MVALLLVAAANFATPLLIRVAIDVGFTQAQPSVLAEAVAGLVALAFVRGLFTFQQGCLFAQIQHLSFSYYQRHLTGCLAGPARGYGRDPLLAQSASDNPGRCRSSRRARLH